MAGWLETKRGFQWVVIVCVLIFGGLAALQSTLREAKQTTQEVLPDRSLFNTKPSGYGAWYQTIKQAQIPVTIWRKDFKTLIHDTQEPPPEERAAAKKMSLGFQPKAMVIIEPYPYSFSEATFTQNEVAMVLYWVYMGNTVILLDPFERKSMVNILKHLSLPGTQASEERKQGVSKDVDKSATQPKKTKRFPLTIKPTPSWLTENDSSNFRWIQTLNAHIQKPLMIPSEYSHFPLNPEFTMKTVEWREDPLEQVWRKDSEESEDDEKTGDLEDQQRLDTDKNWEEEDSTGLPSPKDFDLSTLMDVPYHPYVLVEDSAHHPVIIGGTYGQGQLIIGTVSGLASNNELFQDGDHFQLMTNLVMSPGLPVLINEYVHGHADEDSVYTHLGKTPLGILYSQAIMLFCLLLWVSLNRWRPVLKQERLIRENSSLRFLQSMAYLYQQTGASPVVLAPNFKKIAALIEPHLPATGPLKEMSNAQLQQLVGTPIAGHVLTENDIDLLVRVQQCLSRNQKLPPKETLALSLATSDLIQKLQNRKMNQVDDPGVLAEVLIVP